MTGLISLLSKGLSGVFSSTTVQRHSYLYTHSVESFFFFFFMTGCWILSKAFPSSTEFIMIFILQFVNVPYYTDWSADTEPSLHPCDKSYMIMVYNPFNILLNSLSIYFCWGFLHQCSSVIWACLCFSFFVVSLSAFGIRVMLAS